MSESEQYDQDQCDSAQSDKDKKFIAEVMAEKIAKKLKLLI